MSSPWLSEVVVVISGARTPTSPGLKHYFAKKGKNSGLVRIGFAGGGAQIENRAG